MDALFERKARLLPGRKGGRWLAWLGLGLAAVAAAKAGLVWDQPEVRVAAKPGQEAVALDFGFKNAGAAPIRILSLTPSCGCTTAVLDKKEFAPGEIGRIHVTVRIARSEAGTLRKTIAVQTSDGTAPPSTLAVVVELSPLVKPHPEVVEWRLGEPALPKTVMLEVEAGSGVSLSRASSSNSAIGARLEAVSAGRYALSLAPKATDRPAAAVVSVRADVAGAAPRFFDVYVGIR
jgi:hypothetical protein